MADWGGGGGGSLSHRGSRIAQAASPGIRHLLNRNALDATTAPFRQERRPGWAREPQVLEKGRRPALRAPAHLPAPGGAAREVPGASAPGSLNFVGSQCFAVKLGRERKAQSTRTEKSERLIQLKRNRIKRRCYSDPHSPTTRRAAGQALFLVRSHFHRHDGPEGGAVPV